MEMEESGGREGGRGWGQKGDTLRHREGERERGAMEEGDERGTGCC